MTAAGRRDIFILYMEANIAGMSVMGLIYVTVGLSNPPATDAAEEVNAMVATGSLLSIFPTNMLERLGIRRIGQRRLHGFGGVTTRPSGTVNLTYGGEIAGVTVIFGKDHDPAIMGLIALQSLGFNVDPVAGELTPVETLMY